MPIPVLVIIGPTGSGKTDSAVLAAKALDGEVITADSMQVYRHMDIGTAKPTLEERQGIPHHLIDVANPDDEFTVVQYVTLADAVISDLHARGKVPIVAGGTGLYVNALIDRWEFPPQPADMTFRERLQEEADRLGFETLHARLRAIDPATAERLHPNDVRRVIRALEVYELTGRPVSSFQYKPGEGSHPSPYCPLMYGLTVPRGILYERLERRVQQQLEAGLLDEVRRLDEAGYSPDLASMKGITYRQLLGYLHGQYDFQTAIELMVRDNRRYAKRQYTWFKPDPRIHWVDVTEAGGAAGVAEIVTQGWRAFAG